MGLDARTVNASNAREIAEWCDGVVVDERDALDHSAVQPGINVLCGSGVKRASVGSVVIQNQDGTFDVLYEGI